MFRKLSALSALVILATSCTHQKDDTVQQATAQQQALQPRPIIALVPIVDNTKNDLPWSLSEELTSTIHYRLSQKGNVYLSDQNKVVGITKHLNKSQNPFSDNLSWVKKAFNGSEFVVFMELIEHVESPLKSSKDASRLDAPAELNMSMRVRVVDLRSSQPAIVLQEMVHDSHHVPKQFTRANFHQVPWGQDSFNISPLGLAHAQFTKEIASRVEDYVILAKNRIASGTAP
jgi:hypothetical protein